MGRAIETTVELSDIEAVVRDLRDSIAFIQLAIDQAKEKDQTQLVVYNWRSAELALTYLNTFTHGIKKGRTAWFPSKKTEDQNDG